MMNAESIGQEILQIGIVDRVGFLLQDFSACRVRTHDMSDGFQLDSLVPDILGCFCSLLARMNEDQHLILIRACVLEDL